MNRRPVDQLHPPGSTQSSKKACKAFGAMFDEINPRRQPGVDEFRRGGLMEE